MPDEESTNMQAQNVDFRARNKQPAAGQRSLADGWIFRAEKDLLPKRSGGSRRTNHYENSRTGIQDQGRLAAAFGIEVGVWRGGSEAGGTTLRKAFTSALSCCTLSLSITEETEGCRVPAGRIGRVPTTGVVCLIVVLTGSRVET